MNEYIMHFVIYTLAMTGFIAAVLFIYKKSMIMKTSADKRDFLKVENFLRLSPSKTLYVIKAGREKFLIACDTSSTTMLSKLEAENNNESEKDFGENMSN